VLKRHLSYIEKYKPVREQSRVGNMRKVALWYLKGFPEAAKMRGLINDVQSYDEMLKIINKLILETCE